MPPEDDRSPILVIGTGELGNAVLRAMLPRAAETDVRIDVLVRSTRNSDTDFVQTGGRPVVCDIAAASEAELAALFGHYDTIVSCIGFAAGSGMQLKLARAALASGVRRYFPWQFGADYDALGRGSPQPLFDEQLDVRGLLREQTAMRWVIVSVGMFTSFLFEPSFGVVDLDQGVVRALGSWDNAVTVTTPEDIGQLTTEIVFTEPEFSDEVVYLAGDTITYARLAKIVEHLLGRSIDREVLTVPDLMADLADSPGDTMRRYRAVFAIGRGMWWNKAQTFNARENIAVTDAESWLRAHLADKRQESVA